MKLNALLSALLMGLVAPAAMAATYTYAGPDVRVQDSAGNWFSFLGAYNVADGPSWGPGVYRPATQTVGPPVYSALEAATMIFGGQQSDYAVSIYSPFYDPTQTILDPALNNSGVPTNPPLFDLNLVTGTGTGQIVAGQTVSKNAKISHTGWYDRFGFGREPDPAILLPDPNNLGAGLIQTLTPTAQAYVTYAPPGAPDAGVMYTIPSGTGVGPQIASNFVSLFAKAEARNPSDLRYLTDGTLLDPLPAGYSAPATGSWSAYVNDKMGGAPERAFFTNYVWKVAPIPEPETYAMMLAGLGLITLMARRRMNG